MSLRHLMQQHGLLQQMAQSRVRELREADWRNRRLVEQLVALNICPCVAMGRASTCCGVPSEA